MLKNLGVKQSSQNVSNESFVGSYGNPVEGIVNDRFIFGTHIHIVASLGDVEISLQNGTLYFRFGTWATGYLLEYPNITNTYTASWDSDFVQDIYFNVGSLVDVFVQFENVDTLHFYFDDVYTFRRGVSLDTLPIIPWDPQSCAPEI